MNNQCDNCGNPYLTAEWEAALDERDKEITRLRKALASLIGACEEPITGREWWQKLTTASMDAKETLEVASLSSEGK